MTTARQSRIELMLCEEFAAEGHRVEKADSGFVARLLVIEDGGQVRKVVVDLTRLAETIDRRLP